MKRSKSRPASHRKIKLQGLDRRYDADSAEAIDIAVLETFPYEYPERDVVVNIETDEFTAVCPYSGLPDYATIRVNYIPGKLEELGLAPQQLWEHNPKLIVTRISGWGQTGPYSSRPGFGTLAEAAAGFIGLNGYADLPPLPSPLPTESRMADGAPLPTESERPLELREVD